MCGQDKLTAFVIQSIGTVCKASLGRSSAGGELVVVSHGDRISISDEAKRQYAKAKDRSNDVYGLERNPQTWGNASFYLKEVSNAVPSLESTHTGQTFCLREQKAWSAGQDPHCAIASQTNVLF